MAAVTLPIVDTAVAGCTYIYAPKGRAGEYAPLAANPYRGCGHACAYCYVPIVLKMKRPVFDAGAIPRPDFIKHLTKDAKKYQAAGITEQVMLSFTSDPYHPGDSSLTRETLMVLRDHGLGIATLTKGGTRALRDVDLFRPDRDAFASTLTSLDESFAHKWERGAAAPSDRLKALRAFHDAGNHPQLVPREDSGFECWKADRELSKTIQLDDALVAPEQTEMTAPAGCDLCRIDERNDAGA